MRKLPFSVQGLNLHARMLERCGLSSLAAFITIDFGLSSQGCHNGGFPIQFASCPSQHDNYLPFRLNLQRIKVHFCWSFMPFCKGLRSQVHCCMFIIVLVLCAHSRVFILYIMEIAFKFQFESRGTVFYRNRLSLTLAL